MRILVVDDHGLMRDGLRALLAREPDLEVAGDAADGHEAVALAASLRPDVVLMDVCMPGLDGVEATRRIVEARPATRVLGLSMHADRTYVHGMFAAGATGYVLKSAAPKELFEAIRAVHAARRYVSPGIAGAPDGPRPALAARELEVLRLLADGKSSKEVAAELGLAVSTVETYRRQIMAKLDLHSVAELTKYALRHGLTAID